MGKKIFCLAVLMAVVFFSGTAGAQYYTISNHSIDITIDEEGFALISEKFFLQFPNEFQLQEFRAKNEEIGISLDSWKQFDKKIHTYIGKESELNRAEVSFVENDSKYLEIKYSLNTPVAGQKAETSRLIEFGLSQKYFDQFIQGGVYIIPDSPKTTITVNLPNFAEIQKPVKPEGIVTGNQLQWDGYKSTNVIELNYVLVKQIASISLAESLNAFVQSPLFLVLIAVAAVFLAIAAAKRKAISQKIEDFIVENSELGGKEDSFEEEKDKIN
ncbi:MAG: hypothetical protein PHH08_00540 [Candidatus ainarchaeum sp.]|nr:hypothetical protein [Candidatus ainarchaeum sp.]